MSVKDVDVDEKVDNVINTVASDVGTAVDESNDMNKKINERYVNCLDKALEIFSFHKTTNYILVTIGTFLIFWGIFYSAYVEYQQNLIRQIQNGENNLTAVTPRELQNEQGNPTAVTPREKQEQQENNTLIKTLYEKQYTLENNGFYSMAATASESMLNPIPSVMQIQNPPFTLPPKQETTNANQTPPIKETPKQIRNTTDQNQPTTKEPDSSNSHWWISLLSTGSGLTLLVTSFFYKSQKYAQQSITNLAIINIVFKSHYTNHIITRILIQLRLIEVKKKWPEMKTEIDIIKHQVESLRKNERKFSSRMNKSSETSNVPFGLPTTSDTSNISNELPTSETGNVNSDPLVSLLSLIETMTAQTERHITLLQKANMDNIIDK